MEPVLTSTLHQYSLHKRSDSLSFSSKQAALSLLSKPFVYEEHQPHKGALSWNIKQYKVILELYWSEYRSGCLQWIVWQCRHSWSPFFPSPFRPSFSSERREKKSFFYPILSETLLWFSETKSLRKCLACRLVGELNSVVFCFFCFQLKPPFSCRAAVSAIWIDFDWSIEFCSLKKVCKLNCKLNFLKLNAHLVF